MESNNELHKHPKKRWIEQVEKQGLDPPPPKRFKLWRPFETTQGSQHGSGSTSSSTQPVPSSSTQPVPSTSTQPKIVKKPEYKSFRGIIK